MPERTEDGNQQYLYLTTTGWRSGQARKIEIWFTGYQDRYYVISFLFEKGQWVMNLRKNPEVSFRVGDQRFKGSTRVLDPAIDAETSRAVKSLSDQKYGWSDGFEVELNPSAPEQTNRPWRPCSCRKTLLSGARLPVRKWQSAHRWRSGRVA